MRKYLKSILVLTALCTILSGSAYARISAPMNLVKDKEKADIICTGSVVKDSGFLRYEENKGALVELIFHIDRIAKGDIPAGASIKITYYEDAVNSKGQLTTTPRESIYPCMLVLLRKQGNSYTFSNNANSTIPVSSVDSIGYIRTNDVNQNLRQELINSILTASQDCTEENKKILTSVLNQHKILTPADIQTYVVPLMYNSDIGIKSCAMRAVLASGDLSHLKEIVDFLINNPIRNGNPDVRHQLLLENEIANIKLESEHIPILGKALTSEDYSLRMSVMQLFIKSKGPLLLPYLRNALDDIKPGIRMIAMRGIAGILDDKTPIPLADEYSNNPDAYKNLEKYFKDLSGK